MKSIILLNKPNLIVWLSDNGIKYEILNDGWRVQVFYQADEDLFNIGYFWARFEIRKLNEPVLISTLEASGELPTA